MADSHVTLVGNLTDDPELRFTPTGAAVANFRLAVTPRVHEGDAWKDGETSYFRVNVSRDQAENVAESLGKGTRALVVGRLRQRSWTTPEGEQRSVIEVEADEVAPSLRWATARPERTRRGQAPRPGPAPASSATSHRSRTPALIWRAAGTANGRPPSCLSAPAAVHELVVGGGAGHPPPASIALDRGRPPWPASGAVFTPRSRLRCLPGGSCRGDAAPLPRRTLRSQVPNNSIRHIVLGLHYIRHQVRGFRVPVHQVLELHHLLLLAIRQRVHLAL